MRDFDTIDSELLSAVWWSIREHGGKPSSHLVDELLDERNELTGDVGKWPPKHCDPLKVEPDLEEPVLFEG
jgi:hypothetical protein